MRLHTPAGLVQARGEGHPQRWIVPVAVTVPGEVQEVFNRLVERFQILLVLLVPSPLLEEVLAVNGLGEGRLNSEAAHQGENLLGIAVGICCLGGQAVVQYLIDKLALLSWKDDMSGQAHRRLEGVVSHGDKLRTCALVVVSRVADESGLLAG